MKGKKRPLFGNRSAAKQDDTSASSFIHARCRTSDKARWVIAAQRRNMKLTEWIVDALNSAASSSKAEE